MISNRCALTPIEAARQLGLAYRVTTIGSRRVAELLVCYACARHEHRGGEPPSVLVTQGEVAGVCGCACHMGTRGED